MLVLGEVLGDLVHLGCLIHRTANEEDPSSQWSQPASRYPFTVSAAPSLNPTRRTTPSCRRALPVSQTQCPAASRTFPREKYCGRPVSHAHASAPVAKARRIGRGIRNGVGCTPRASPRASPTCSHVKAPSPATWKISPERTSSHPPGDLQDAAVSGTVHDGGTQHGHVQAIPYPENGRLTLQLAPPVGGNRTGRDVLGTRGSHRHGAYRGQATQVDEAAWSPRCFQARVDQTSGSLTIDAEKLPRRAGPRQSGHVVDLVHSTQALEERTRLVHVPLDN